VTDQAEALRSGLIALRRVVVLALATGMIARVEDFLGTGPACSP
jgi:hypothetical protein